MVLARALYAVAKGTRLLVLDEPTAHVDVRTEFQIFQRLAEKRGDTSVVLISHRLSTVRLADRIVLLADGKIAETGTHDELMAGNGSYAGPSGSRRSDSGRTAIRGGTVTRIIRLWGDIFKLSWKRVPWLTLGAVTCLAGKIAATSGSALALRYAVNAAAGGTARTAMIGGAATAVAYAILIVTQDTTDVLILNIADRVGRMDIHPEIHRSLATIEGSRTLSSLSSWTGSPLSGRPGGGSRPGCGTRPSRRSTSSTCASCSRCWGPLTASWSCWWRWPRCRSSLMARGSEPSRARTCRPLTSTACSSTSLTSASPLALARSFALPGAGRAIADRQAAAWRESMSLRFRAQVKAAVWTLLGWTIFVVALGAGLVIAAYQASRGQGTAGDLVLLVTIAATLRASVQSTVESITAAASPGSSSAPTSG